MFFSNWSVLAELALTGVLAYAALVLLLRISGKRTLSKMNAFDLVVTVALGSTLASVLVSHEIALSDGIAALALLVALQYAVAWGGVRWPWLRHTVRSEPTLLLRRGEFLGQAMHRERVAVNEVLAAVRSQGISVLSEVEAVVLETDGSFSVLRRSGEADVTTLRDVRGAEAKGSA